MWQLFKTTTNGYTGYHIIYKLKTNENNSKNILVELQLRTKLQHLWATSVEMYDLFQTKNLKTSPYCNDAIHNFFIAVSKLFYVYDWLFYGNKAITNDNELANVIRQYR